MNLKTSEIDWQYILDHVYEKYRYKKNNLKTQKGIKKRNIQTRKYNAQYIPALKRVDPRLFSISVCTVEGCVFNVGDYRHFFAIESVSKLFTLALALKKMGPTKILQVIGNKQIQKKFNSISEIALERGSLNAFHNGGAIATTSLFYKNHISLKTYQKIIYDNMNEFAKTNSNNSNNSNNNKIKMSKEIYESELNTADHNRAIAYLLKSYGKLGNNNINNNINVEEVIDVYTRQCSALVTSQQVAIMGSVLANGGTNPLSKTTLLNETNTEYILRHMKEHGMYEESNNWKKTIGYPSKSGVSGIILVVIPNVAGICVISPPIDKSGTSILGKKVIKDICTSIK